MPFWPSFLFGDRSGPQLLRRKRREKVLDLSGLGGQLQPVLQAVGPHETGVLPDEAPRGKDEEIRDGADPEAQGDVGEGLRIHLQDQRPARHLGGDLLHLGAHQAAGTAPGGPEVDEDGNPRPGRDLVEEGGVGLQGFGHGQKLGLARPALGPAGEVSGRYAVLPPAGRAEPDHVPDLTEVV